MTNLNQETVNQAYNQGTSYVVRSTACNRVDFGTINLPGIELYAIVVEFTNGTEYLYINVSFETYTLARTLIQAHIATQGEVRIGSWLANNLFNSHTCYARMHR